MRDYGSVSPRFWTGGTGKQLRGDKSAQILSLYLMTSPHSNMIGVFHCPIMYMAHETGLSSEEINVALERLKDIGFCLYDEDTESVFVVRMAAHQVGDLLSPGGKRLVGIRREWERIAPDDLRNAYFDVYADGHWLRDEPKIVGPRKGLASPSEAPSDEGEGTSIDKTGTGQDKRLMSGKPDVEAELLDYLNKKTGRAFQPVAANRTLLKARLKESNADEIRAVIDAKVRQWGRDAKMSEFLRPATLFSAKNFAQYVGALGESDVINGEEAPWANAI